MILLTTISTFDDSGDNLDQGPMIDIDVNLWEFNTYTEILTFRQDLCFPWLMAMPTCKSAAQDPTEALTHWKLHLLPEDDDDHNQYDDDDID